MEEGDARTSLDIRTEVSFSGEGEAVIRVPAVLRIGVAKVEDSAGLPTLYQP